MNDQDAIKHYVVTKVFSSCLHFSSESVFMNYLYSGAQMEKTLYHSPMQRGSKYKFHDHRFICQ